MTRKHMMEQISSLFTECLDTHSKGQKEYAKEDNAFKNFESVAEKLELGKDKVILTYLLRHIDGICTYVNGMTDQRDSIDGRIQDAIIYLALLHSVMKESDSKSNVDYTKITLPVWEKKDD